MAQNITFNCAAANNLDEIIFKTNRIYSTNIYRALEQCIYIYIYILKAYVRRVETVSTTYSVLRHIAVNHVVTFGHQINYKTVFSPNLGNAGKSSMLLVISIISIIIWSGAMASMASKSACSTAFRSLLYGLYIYRLTVGWFTARTRPRKTFDGQRTKRGGRLRGEAQPQGDGEHENGEEK